MSDPTAQPTSGGSAPANTGTPGKRTPAERARLAALARWGKYKGQGKQKKGKKGRKPAATPEAKEAQRRQEAQANRANVLNSFGSFGRDTLPDLEAMAAGNPPADADGMIMSGLAEKLENGSVVLTSEGKKLYNAASRGDVAGAKDAIARAESNSMARDEKAKAKSEKEAQAKEEKPKGGGGGGGGSAKPSDEEKDKERKEKRQAALSATRADIKERMASADTGLSPSGFDAFTSFADGGDMPERMAEDFRGMGLTEGSPSRLTEAGRSLRNAIDRGDLRGAVDAIERGKAKKKSADDREAERQAREKERADRDKAPRRRPMRDGIRINQGTKAMDYTDALNGLLDIVETLEGDSAIKAGRRHNAADEAMVQAICDLACDIVEIACELGARPPEEEEVVEESMDYSVKMLPDGRVGGYAVRFGSADEPDLSQFQDFFTKSTDYWLAHWQTRPMLYHHAQDEATKDAPVVGVWTKAKVDDIGVWLEGQLDSAHRYAGAVKELIRRGVIKLSSDSAPHLVIREPQPNGTNWVKRWPMLAASLTVSPAEPRLMPVAALKAAFDAAGLDLPPAFLDETDGDTPVSDMADPEVQEPETSVEASPDQASETDPDSSYKRLLSLELELLELEAA